MLRMSQTGSLTKQKRLVLHTSIFILIANRINMRTCIVSYCTVVSTCVTPAPFRNSITTFVSFCLVRRRVYAIFRAFKVDRSTGSTSVEKSIGQDVQVHCKQRTIKGEENAFTQQCCSFVSSSRVVVTSNN